MEGTEKTEEETK